MANPRWLSPWMLMLLAGCGGGGGVLPGPELGGSVQGLSVPAGSKAVLLSISSNPAFKLAEASIAGSSFTLKLPDEPSVDALGPVFEAPTGCTGVSVQPAGAEAVWARISLEVAGQPAGELIAQSGDKDARWVYAEVAATISGTLACPAPARAGALRPQVATGTAFNLNLQQGWNLVLTDSQETNFTTAPLNTSVTWGGTTPNDLSLASGSDAGSSATRLKGSLGVTGYGVALQVRKPEDGVPGAPFDKPAATTGDGAFDLPLPVTVSAGLLGAASSLNAATCTGALAISNPSAQYGELALSVYRGQEAIGKAALVTYATVVGWWYASSPFTVTGAQTCGSGDSQSTTTYNLNLQAGWNLVQKRTDSVRDTIEWSNLTAVPADGKWLPELEDSGVGVSPGAFGGPDKGSTATRMSGKLGGWTDTQAATLKVETDGGVSLVTGPLSATGEFDLTLPATVADTAFESLALTQECGAGVTSTPADPKGARAAFEPDRNDAPIGLVAAGGRGFTVDWVYAATATQVSGTETCPSGDGGSEEHRYAITFTPGWNLLIEQVFSKDGLEYTEHKSGPLPGGTQWFFEADADPGLPDTGSTRTSLSGSVGAGFAAKSLRLKIGSSQIDALTLGAAGEVTRTLPATVAAKLLGTLNPSRSACTGTLTVTPGTSKYGALGLEVWDGTKFKSAVLITNEDSDGSVETLAWWYLAQDTTVTGTQSCTGQVNRTFKYDLSLKAGWNLVLEHEEEDPSGDRDTKYSTVNQAPNGTRWGTN